MNLKQCSKKPPREGKSVGRQIGSRAPMAPGNVHASVKSGTLLETELSVQIPLSPCVMPYRHMPMAGAQVECGVHHIHASLPGYESADGSPPLEGANVPRVPKVVVSSAVTQGGRSYQEDRSAWRQSSAKQPYDVFNVIDGHSGLPCLESPTAWDYALQHLPRAMDARMEPIHAVDQNGLLACSSSVITAALEGAYLDLDAEILSQGMCGGAANVSCVLIGNTLLVSHVGDCRAILCRDGLPVFVTTDHTPAVDAERDRVVRSGGIVRVDMCNQISRVTLDDGGACGQSIMMTRSLGDGALKQILTARPAVASMELTEGHNYLLLATDGVFENMDTAEVVKVLNDSIQTCKWIKFEGQDMAEEMANGLIEMVELKASMRRRISDNATAMVVLFDWRQAAPSSAS